MAQFPEPRKLGHLQLMKVWLAIYWYTVRQVLECLPLRASEEFPMI